MIVPIYEKDGVTQSDMYNTSVLTKIYKSIKSKNVDETFYSNVLSDFLEENHSQNSVESLKDFAKVFNILSTHLTEKVNILAKNIKNEEDKLKDTFIESFKKETTLKQAAILDYSGLAKNTVMNYRKKDSFIANGSTINVRSFLEWLKCYDFNVYQNFKEKWIKSNQG